MFAGYDRYRALQLSERVCGLGLQKLLPRGDWETMGGRGGRRSLVRRWQRFVEALDAPPERRYLRWLQISMKLRDGRCIATNLPSSCRIAIRSASGGSVETIG